MEILNNVLVVVSYIAVLVVMLLVVRWLVQWLLVASEYFALAADSDKKAWYSVWSRNVGASVANFGMSVVGVKRVRKVTKD